MKKKYVLPVICLLTVVLALSGCGCRHEFEKATCEEPATCSLCGETEGEPRGHRWEDADCEDPETCSRCEETKGKPLGHSWLDATTEDPETCENCGDTRGEKLDIDPRFSTAATKELYGTWRGAVPISGEKMDMQGYLDYIDIVMILEFDAMGNYCLQAESMDKEKLVSAMETMTIDLLYQGLAAEGLDKDAANEAMKQTYGMDVEEYAVAAIAEMDVDGVIADAMEASESEGVYYVEYGMVYVGTSWDDSFGSDASYLEGDTLMVDMGDGEMIPFTRVD